MIHEFIQEINANNGSNYKLDILKKYTQEEIKRLLKMTYDKVAFTYGIKIIPKYLEASIDVKEYLSIGYVLTVLESRFCTREVTGNNAIDLLSEMLSKMKTKDALVIEKVLGRDLKINVGRTSINKIHKGLITKPVYQRCDVYTEDGFDKIKNKPSRGTSNKIKYPAKLDLKSDGSYREVTVGEKVEFVSRSGEEYFYDNLARDFIKLPKGRYFGELTVELTQELLDKIIPDIRKEDSEMADSIIENFNNGDIILPRALGNGLINSDDVPYENIKMDVWQYVTEDEYTNAYNKKKNTIEYYHSFLEMEGNINKLQSKYIRVCEYILVYSKQEALTQVSEWMNKGLEGGVLKNLSMVFRDGTNSEQLKMKLSIDIEVRCVGFSEGKKGTARELTFGAMIFENDEWTIKGQCSGFTDKLLMEINNNREKYIGRVFTVQFNDLSKGRGNDYHALVHPRYIEVRDDKDTTNTLEEALQLKDMAMGLS